MAQDSIILPEISADNFEHAWKRFRLAAVAKQRAGLRLKVNKCHFAQSKVSYLGHIVSKNGVEPDPWKIQAILLPIM